MQGLTGSSFDLLLASRISIHPNLFNCIMARFLSTFSSAVLFTSIFLSSCESSILISMKRKKLEYAIYSVEGNSEEIDHL